MAKKINTKGRELSFTESFDMGSAFEDLVGDAGLAEEEARHQAADSGPDHDHTGVGVLLAVRHCRLRL